MKIESYQFIYDKKFKKIIVGFLYFLNERENCKNNVGDSNIKY